jgi:hypothetical protein
MDYFIFLIYKRLKVIEEEHKLLDRKRILIEDDNLNMTLKIEQSDREYNMLKKQRKISLLQMKILEDEYEMLKKQEKVREEYMNQPYPNNGHHPPLKHIKNSHPEPSPHFPPPRPVYIPYNNHQMPVPSLISTIPLSNSHREREFPDEKERLSSPLRLPASQQRGTSNIPVNNHGKRTETTDYRATTTTNIKQSSPPRLIQSTYKQAFYRNNKTSFPSPSRKYKTRYSPNRDKKNKDITTKNGDKGKQIIYMYMYIV